MQANATDRLTYADQPGWRSIQDRLPAHLHDAGLVIDPADPGTVPDEGWFHLAGTDLHLDRYAPLGPAAAAPATLLLVHGGDADGRLLAPYALMAARAVANDPALVDAIAHDPLSGAN